MLLALLIATTSSSTPPPTAPLHRIVSLAPAITEIICALGAEQALVGVTRFDDFPESVKKLPKVGGFIDPSIDAIVGLAPDGVVTNPNQNNQQVTRELGRWHIPWIAIDDARLEDFSPMVRSLATLLGATARGEELIRDFDRELENLPSVIGSAVILYGHSPLVAAGPGSFGSELLARGGLANAYRGANRYPHLDMEALLQMRPRFIIDLDMGGPKSDFFAPYREAMKVRGIDVAQSADPALLRLGPRLPSAMRRLLAGLPK